MSLVVSLIFKCCRMCHALAPFSFVLHLVDRREKGDGRVKEKKRRENNGGLIGIHGQGSDSKILICV